MDWKWGTAKEEEVRVQKRGVSLCSGLRILQGDDGARHLPFLSFLYVILAIAKRNQPEDLGSDADAKAGALKVRRERDSVRALLMPCVVHHSSSTPLAARWQLRLQCARTISMSCWPRCSAAAS